MPFLQQLGAELPGGTASGPGINSGGAVPNAAVTVMHGRIFLANWSINFSSVPLNPYKAHGPGAGDFIISVFLDQTHVYLLGPGGLTDTIY
jgi:hypothetical protein